MRLKLRLLCVLFLGAFISQSVLAWWSGGHHCIDRAAALALPADMPEFFRNSAGVIASYSMDPDLWKNRGLPVLRSNEDSNHYLDLELLEGRELPKTRDGFLKLCSELRLAPDKVGTLPYAIQEWHDRLVVAFAEHRKWPEDEAVQAKILYIAGVLSHYTGDASQPLHCTIHHDGRAKADGSSPRTGIHLKMDALPGQLGLGPEEVAEGLKAEAVEDVFGRVIAAMKESHKRVDRVYELEDRLPPAEGRIDGKPDEDIRKIALDCVKAGAELTATLWYSAWVKSADVQLPGWHNADEAQERPEG